MRRIAGLALLLLAACGTDGDMSAGDTSTSSPAETTPVAASCAPSVESPFNGISAVTDDGDVRVWVRPGPDGWIEFPDLGDDPDAPPTEGDGSYVESVAVVPSTCGVFVALCCEPVIGLTKWFETPDAAPVDLYGRLPAVSPDGTRVALVGLDTVAVRSVEDPAGAGTDIGLPGAGSGLVLDMMWIDGDRLALIMNVSGEVRLHVAVASEGTLRPGVPLAAGSTGVSAVLRGVIEGNVVVSERTEETFIVESFDAASFGSTGTVPGDPDAPFVRRVGARTVTIARDGSLGAHADGQIDPTPLGDGYWWAG